MKVRLACALSCRFLWFSVAASLLLGAGCSPQPPQGAPPQTGSAPPAGSIPQHAESQPLPQQSDTNLDPKLTEYRAAVESYLSRARTAADTIESVPSPEKAAELVQEFNRLYGELPPAPDGLDEFAHIQTPLNNIKKSFIVAESIAKLQGDITVKQRLSVMANDIRGFAKKAESKMTDAGL